ncbi:MAG: phosphoadenosine phosphosulfate reductase family protein, partial [Anaerolineae bacterium]
MSNSVAPTVRHIVSLSGGKDSTALAIYMRDRIPDVEYVFCDTGEELPETYEYLDKLEVFLGSEIKRLRAKQSFE